jgi:hypothetical protein
MGDINRRPSDQSVHNVHIHTCPSCHRNYSCNCSRQTDKTALTCIDCETATYDPMIHGGTGTRSEA